MVKITHRGNNFAEVNLAFMFCKQAHTSHFNWSVSILKARNTQVLYLTCEFVQWPKWLSTLHVSSTCLLPTPSIPLQNDPLDIAFAKECFCQSQSFCIGASVHWYNRANSLCTKDKVWRNEFPCKPQIINAHASKGHAHWFSTCWAATRNEDLVLYAWMSVLNCVILQVLAVYEWMRMSS